MAGHLPAGVRGDAELKAANRSVVWVSWLLALAMISAVVVAALHYSEERELIRIAQRAQPWWLIIAILLQVGTYFAQGETWRTVMRAAAIKLPLMLTFRLSLAKLFIDQALPSGGRCLKLHRILVFRGEDCLTRNKCNESIGLCAPQRVNLELGS
jgi:hypothetical protein